MLLQSSQLDRTETWQKRRSSFGLSEKTTEGLAVHRLNLHRKWSRQQRETRADHDKIEPKKKPELKRKARRYLVLISSSTRKTRLKRLVPVEALAGFPHLGELDVDGAATDLSLVHSLESCVSRGLLWVGNKAETPAAASFTVVNNVGLGDGSELSEHLQSNLLHHVFYFCRWDFFKFKWNKGQCTAGTPRRKVSRETLILVDHHRAHNFVSVKHNTTQTKETRNKHEHLKTVHKSPAFWRVKGWGVGAEGTE